MLLHPGQPKAYHNDIPQRAGFIYFFAFFLKNFCRDGTVRPDLTSGILIASFNLKSIVPPDTQLAKRSLAMFCTSAGRYLIALVIANFTSSWATIP